ncbi:MAG: GTP-binding protein [Anaerovoracaceae bacterium]|jgi:G3E family GTPase
MDIPVYLVTGFLEAGKTKFIQELLEGSDFNAGERTLLLLCEEGIEEYDPSRFSFNNVVIETVDDEEDLSVEGLDELCTRAEAERVVVEYNGMWPMNSFYENMPREWIIYQQIMFADAGTFEMYNQNMRQLTFDKMQGAEIVIFNRCRRGELNKEALHKIVRVANRKSQILYEYGENDVEPDTIKDPLPYDIDAPVITIRDSDFAEWYRDINDESEKYDGKTVRVKCRVLTEGKLPENTFVMGRHLMTCCVQDIQFAGLAARWPKVGELKHGGWYALTADIKVEYEDLYHEEGPVLHCRSIERAQKAEPEVASF